MLRECVIAIGMTLVGAQAAFSQSLPRYGIMELGAGIQAANRPGQQLYVYQALLIDRQTNDIRVCRGGFASDDPKAAPGTLPVGGSCITQYGWDKNKSLKNVSLASKFPPGGPPLPGTTVDIRFVWLVDQQTGDVMLCEFSKGCFSFQMK